MRDRFELIAVSLIAFVTLLLLIASSILLIKDCEGSELKLRFTHSGTRAIPDTCVLADTLPGYPLSRTRIDLVQLKYPLDTLTLWMPAEGRDGQRDSLLLWFADSVTMGTATFRDENIDGTLSCGYASYLFTFPLVEPPPFQPGLFTEYFDDMALSVPISTAISPNIDFDWDASSPLPSIDPETFSIRFTGILTVSTPGTYQFRACVEDAIRLWIDGIQIMDDWTPQSEHNTTAALPLASGSRPFRLEYFARFGNAALRLFWTPPGSTESIIPPSALSHQ
jgi:hypothetical protein